MDGIIIIDKPKGFTSFDVVAKLRGMLHQKKIGHTGTLDPDATGVLPVLLGKATKLSDMLTAQSKTYEATLRLGVKTDTLDMSGEVISKRPVTADESEVRTVIKSFIKTYEQMPPMYSAIKVDGKKLYELARQGVEVERKARLVTIADIEITDVSLPLVTMKVTCSKGTYIRSLCDDIGEEIGCGGAMQELRRLASGDFRIEDAVTLDDLQKLIDEGGDASEAITPLEEALSFMPRFIIGAAYDKALKNGNLLKRTWGSGEIDTDGTLVFSAAGELVGIYETDKNGMLRPQKMLL